MGCDSIIISVHPTVYSAVTHQNVKGAFFDLYISPRVNAEPVFLSVFNPQVDIIDGVITLSGSSKLLAYT